MTEPRSFPGLGLIGAWPLGDDTYKPDLDADLRTLSVVAQLTVLSKVTALPGSPTNGMIYIVPSGGDAKKIAIRDDGAWVYLVPAEGWFAWVADEDKLYVHDGSDWIEFSSGGGSGAWLTGSGAPDDGDGNDDDFYLQSNGDVYQKVSGTWGSVLFNLKGPPGDPGDPGAGFVDRGPWDTDVDDYVPFDFVTFGSPTRVYMCILAADDTIADPATATTYWVKMGAPGVDGDPGPPGDPGDDGLNAVMTAASTTSWAMATGSKAFTYSTIANLGWTVGMRLRVYNDSTHYGEGIITAVTSTQVTVTIDRIVGSGTLAVWTIGVAGDKGDTGAGSIIVAASTTSLLMALASKAFSFSAIPEIGWVIGQRLRAYNDASHYMEGVITAVSTTGVTITVDYMVGTGTFAVWNLGLAGDRGVAGSNGTSYPARTINAQTGTTYTITNADLAGNVILTLNNASPIVVTVPASLTGIESLMVKQLGAGQVAMDFSAVSAAYANGLKLYGQNSAAVLTVLGTNVYGWDGDTAV